ncbi:MBL protein, partial [Polypterus senegalus]
MEKKEEKVHLAQKETRERQIVLQRHVVPLCEPVRHREGQPLRERLDCYRACISEAGMQFTYWSRYGQKMFATKNDTLNFKEGVKLCKEANGEIAIPVSAGENNALWQLVKLTGVAYLGVNDLKTEGQYEDFNTRNPVMFTNWRSGEPNDYGSREDCSEMKPHLATVPFPLSNISDPTGLPCLLALFISSSIPIDSNYITLSLLFPYSSHDSPIFQPDEGMQFTDWSNYGHKRFGTKNDQLTFDEGVNFCKEASGEIAMPANEGENAALMKLVPSSGGVYLGLNDRVTDGRFEDVSGNDMTFTKWKSGEPNNYRGNEDCSIITSDGTWNDVPCSQFQ